MARFFWVIRLYARNGFFVMIDDHTEDPTFSQSPSTWLQVRCRACQMLVSGDHGGLCRASQLVRVIACKAGNCYLGTCDACMVEGDSAQHGHMPGSEHCAAQLESVDVVHAVGCS